MTLCCMQLHFPVFVDFYYSGHMKYFQWKSDFVRYLLLYKYGGIYIDLGTYGARLKAIHSYLLKSSLHVTITTIKT